MWQWDHRAEGQSVWTHYSPDGKRKQQSEWQGEMANGPAALWDQSGQVIGRYTFKDGVIIK